MPAADPNWTDVLQTMFIGGQLALLVTAAIFGWRQLSEAKQLREEQTRPFVVIDLGSTRPKFFDLVIKNIGTTMARDVKFKFDPPAESTIPEAAHDRLKMFREAFPRFLRARKYGPCLMRAPLVTMLVSRTSTR